MNQCCERKTKMKIKKYDSPPNSNDWIIIYFIKKSFSFNFPLFVLYFFVLYSSFIPYIKNYSFISWVQIFKQNIDQGWRVERWKRIRGDIPQRKTSFRWRRERERERSGQQRCVSRGGFSSELVYGTCDTVLGRHHTPCTWYVHRQMPYSSDVPCRLSTYIAPPIPAAYYCALNLV